MDAQKLPQFFFTENRTELPGAGLIQSNEDPFFIAMIFKFNNDVDAQKFEQTHKPILKVGIYNIYLCMYTSLLPPLREYEEIKVKDLLRQMAEFYTTEKILPNESYHKRFLTGRK